MRTVTMHIMSVEGKVVIVTGASAGIGRETALLLGKRHACVVLAARRKDRLETLANEIEAAGGKALATPADVSDESEMKTVIAQAVERFGRIDVLICNAGAGLLATFAETKPEQMERLMRTNFWSTFYGIRSVLPVMKQQGEGQIIAISSMSGRRGAPLKAAYCASKFAQIGLMESLRMEMIGTKILCTLVFPGATQTEFFDVIENPGGHDAVFYGSVQTAAQVARVIVDSIGSKKPEILTQKNGRLQLVLQAAAPSLADRLAARRKQKVLKSI